MADLNDLKRQEKNIKAQIKARLKKMEKMAANLREDEDDWGPYRNLEAEVVEKTKALTAVLEEIQAEKTKKGKTKKGKTKKGKTKKVTPKKPPFLAGTVVDGIVQAANPETTKVAEDGFGSRGEIDLPGSKKLIESIQAVFRQNWAHPNFNLIVAIYGDATTSDVILDGTTLIISSGKDTIDFQDIGEGLEYVMEETDLSYEEDLDAFDLASELYTFYNS